MKTPELLKEKVAAALDESDDPYGLKLKGERPENILVVNCGSSSLKYRFYDTMDESHQARGQVEGIGIDGTQLGHRGPKGEVKRELPKAGFAEAFKAMVAELTSPETGVIDGAGEVSVVAHRVVHGGEKFTEGTLITERNREARGFDDVGLISTDDSKVTVLVVPTDEERMMAPKALRTLSLSEG